ncbi:hypothetical protein SJI19_01765 [Acerihabitans sp. TG2]|uniref:hypothetical protein n=1 Tax=Acerihabitans sp. TG2 TaxID=3096008 RepID=UPI002B227B4A|nr:hypothetical protein [Acerihabitans sp. TG2]MEA9389290.1 hypothetical protein [Acerihabitans sp. TG2]
MNRRDFLKVSAVSFTSLTAERLHSQNLTSLSDERTLAIVKKVNTLFIITHPRTGEKIAQATIYIGKSNINPLDDKNIKKVYQIIPSGKKIFLKKPLKTNEDGQITIDKVPSPVFIDGDYSIGIKNSSGQLIFVDYHVSDKTHDNNGNILNNNNYYTVCKSIENLRKIIGSNNNDRIHLSSYYERAELLNYGPFGGGDFIWDESCDQPDDGGTFIQPIGINKIGRWIRINRNELNVIHYGADPSGTLDSSDALNRSAMAKVAKIPTGTYKHETLTVSGDGITFTGEGMGKTIIKSSSSIKMFNISGLGGGLNQMSLEYTSSHQSPHFTTSGSRKSFDFLQISGFKSREAQGQGCILGDTNIKQREICNFNNCVVEHASVDIYMSEFKSNQCFFWPISKRFAVRLNGSYCPNAIIDGADFLPPFISYDTPEDSNIASLWIKGPVLQPRIVNCYIDGNPSHITGVGMLFEDGTLLPAIEGGIANKCSHDVIVFDSVIQPSCTMKFYNNNKNGLGASDIVFKKSYPQNIASPRISSTHIQTENIIGKLGYAIRVDNSITTVSGGWIIEPSIRHSSDNKGYKNEEVYLNSIKNQSLIKMTSASGTTRTAIVTGQGSAEIGATSLTLKFSPLPLFYLPDPGQINVTTTAGEIVPTQIQQINIDSVVIKFRELIQQTNFIVRVII